MKNINVLLAKKYINSFYEVLSLSIDEKALKELRKNVEKYEDVMYIKQALTDEIKENIKKRFDEHKQENISRYQSMIERLDSLYKDNFLNKESLDVKGIQKQVSILDKEMVNLTNDEYLKDIHALFEMKNNLDVELRTYVDKRKNDEYMDLALFEQSIQNIFKEAKDALSELIECNKMSSNEYVEPYLDFVYQQYSVIFEGGLNRNKTIPGWAKGLIFCSPWIIGFAVFTLYPLIQTFIFSFSQVNLTPDGFTATPYGFKNYVNIFTTDTDFILALKNYLVEMVVYVPLITIFSLSLAMLLNTKIKSKGFFRTIFFFPVIITSGPVIKILIEQGVTAMGGIDTLVDTAELTARMPELVRIAFNILTGEFTMILWFSGIQILVFVTGLQKIDKGVYEASAIDGANKWEQFWKVTLPAINPTIVINVVFTVVMQSIFALNPIILKIQADMNDTSEGKGYGYSSALAFTYFLVMIIVLVLFVLIFKKKNKKYKEGR